jgi:ABC-2 type transport system permease protein
MVTYAVLSGTVLGAWDPSHMLYGIDRSLKSGDISSQLLRPVPYPAYLFFSELGNLLWRTIAVVVPVVAAAALVYGLQWPASVFHGLMFPAFWLLSFVMLFCFACLGGLLAFWLMTAFSIDWLMWACLSLLSGNFIPLWFFPDWIAGYLKLLPFAWIGFYPAAVYLGKTGVAETVWLFLGGAAWIGLFAVALAALWRAATTRIIVQGG